MANSRAHQRHQHDQTQEFTFSVSRGFPGFHVATAYPVSIRVYLRVRVDRHTIL